ncbi:hypothetical protein FS749_012608, partial [Ceratobasidium sp. UAMH 11750]
MGKEITIVIYKPSTQNTEEYVIVVNPEEVWVHDLKPVQRHLTWVMDYSTRSTKTE